MAGLGKMGSAFQIVTANRLRDGAVVYFGPDRAWVETIEAAARFAGKAEAEDALKAAAAFVTARVVVNPYLIEITGSQNGFKPQRMREVIRAAGPTVRRDLGKQAGLDKQAGR